MHGGETLSRISLMTLIQAFILGFLQGLTEFFPVSSSAHVKLAKLWLGLEGSESQVIFDLVCHLGTLVAVLYFLKNEVIAMLRTERRKLFMLFLATLPLIPCYFVLGPLRHFASETRYLGLCLMLTSGILFLGQRWRLKRKPAPSKRREIGDVLWIGTLQSAALIPGVSRSASTISCASVLGWSAPQAVRFSFLLSIPTIIGGNCLELLKIAVSQESVVHFSPAACMIGFIVSCSVGLLVIRYAMAILEKGRFQPFAWYCLVLGVVVTWLFNFGN